MLGGGGTLMADVEFWASAVLVCSERELEILAQRAADSHWRDIASSHQISERQARRVWNEAIERIAGRIDAHHSRRGAA